MKNLFKELNEGQRKAVRHINGPVIVFAGAGTGKTRVITYRIAYLLSLGVAPESILAVTFTNKAADEMRARVNILVPGKGEKVWISTFHSFCAHFLRKEGEKVGIKKNFVIYDETEQKQVIKECIKDLMIQDNGLHLELIYNTISRAKDNLIDCESYKINSLVYEDNLRHEISDIYILYQKKLKTYNALDFGDLLMKTVECLKTFSDIKQQYSEKYKYIHVDEFQDVNYAQVVLLKLLSSHHNNIFVVGDDDQAIYTWRGGSIRYILNFKKEFSNVKIFKLEKNYRSTKIILDIANEVISYNRNRTKKSLWTENTECSTDDVKILKFDTEYNEAEFIATEIKNLKKEDKNLSIAIFYRTNAQSRIFEEIFRVEKISYKLYGGIGFYERQEVKDIVAYLKILVNPNDNISLKRIINTPSRGIGPTTILYLETLAKEQKTSLWEQLIKIDNTELSLKTKNAVWKFLSLYDMLKKYKDTMFLSEFIQFLVEKTGYLKMLEEEGSSVYNREKICEKLENIEELISSAKHFEQQNQKCSVEDFLSHISLLVDQDIASSSYCSDTNNFVYLMTLHTAKGLEFDVVFITGLEENIFPTWWSIRNNDSELIEEERRLCYVGITRAKRKLYFTYSQTRIINGTLTHLKPSRFIKEVQNYFQKQSYITNQIEDKVLQPVEKIDNLRCGEYVYHEKFGIGKVIDILRDFSGDKVVVLFNDGETRKLHLSYTKLKKL